MKKVLLPFFFGFLLLGTSCSPTRGVGSTQRVSNTNYKLKGNWILTDISYDKDYKIKPFDEMVDIGCFKGSYWKLITNNNSGSYTVSNPKCVGFTTDIKFNVTKEGVFSFKKIPSGTKAKHVRSGYFLQIQNYNSESFELVQDLGNNIKSVVYYFQKMN